MPTATRSNLRHSTRLACGLIPLLNMLRDLGENTTEILHLAGIRKAEFLDPAFTITLEEELAIISMALDIIHTPAPSLDLARYYHLHNFSALGLAIRSCATLGDTFALIRRYPRLMWGMCETRGTINGSLLNFELHAGDSRVERFLLERDMACIKILFGEALNSELNLVEVRFSHPASHNSQYYNDFFQCPVYFNQPVSGLGINLSELEKTIPTSDPLSLEFHEAQCARLSANIDQPFRYTALIRDKLSHINPMPSLEQLARLLDIEPRTLQRRLKKENETYGELLQDIRQKRAMERLLNSLFTTEQIAQELGFNDAVAFSHAFKQWTGVSPRQWRTDKLHQ